MPINVSNTSEKINLEKLLQHNVELSLHTSIHTGGCADLAASPSDFEELRELFAYSRQQNLEITVLGGGTNALISDEGIGGLVILTNHLTRRHVQGEMFCVRCGLQLDKAIDLAIEDGLGGLEMLGGLPGTVGGAIHGNSGAGGTQISDLLYYVDYMTFDGKLHRLNTIAEDFPYRSSPFLKRKDLVLYEAGFRLVPTTQTSEARRVKDDAKKQRKTSGQYDNPSLGCIFLNPPHWIAGKLIEDAGLKGKIIGGAQISHRHGNIIINRNGKATSGDVHELIQFCKQKVLEETGIMLVEEVQYLGRW